MGRYLLALMVFLVPAWAQAPAAVTVFGSDCPYPESTEALRGITVYSFQVGPDNKLTGVAVKQSSGHPELDTRGLVCVSAWRANNDPKWKPSLDSHLVAIKWGPDPSLPTGVVAGHVLLVSGMGKPHTCASEYPEAERDAGVEGRTTVGFRITTEGTVAQPHIVVSSGNENLDQASLACVVNWRYRPAMKDGKPIEVDWKAIIDWYLD